MSSNSSLRNLKNWFFGRSRGRHLRTRRPPVRPDLECLEDRVTPAASFYFLEGASATQTVGHFAPAGGDTNLNNYTATINWGDNTPSSPGTITVDNPGQSFKVTGTHTYAEETVGKTDILSVTIDHVGTGSAGWDQGTAGNETQTLDPSFMPPVIVVDAPLTPGTVSASGGVQGVTPTALTATFTDGNTQASTSDFSGMINWGDGSTTPFTSINVTGTNGNFTVSGSHQYTEATPSSGFAISVVINDVGGSTIVDTTATTVAPSTFYFVEGVSARQPLVTFSPASGDIDPGQYSAKITWGDGSSEFGGIAYDSSTNMFTVCGAHQYAEETPPGSPYELSVTLDHSTGTTNVFDSHWSQVSNTTFGPGVGVEELKIDPPVVVLDAPLTPGTVSASGGLLGTTPTTLTATFTDANKGAPTSDFSGTISWGDGNTTPFTMADVSGSNGSYTINSSYQYTEASPPGGYAISVVINDVGGSTTTDTGTTTISPASPSIAVTPGGTVQLGSGSDLTASATLSGGYFPTGSITFYLFDPTVTANSNGTGAAYSDTVTVTGNSSYSTATGISTGSSLPTMAGNYQWVAVYSSGDGNNNGATSINQLIPATETVTPASQSIKFTSLSPINLLPNETVTLTATGSGTGGVGSGKPIVFSIDPSSTGTRSITLTATGGASSNPVVFSIDTQHSTGTGSINGNILTVTGAGSFVIDANQAGNTNYSAAPQVQLTLVVNPASQSITFTALSPIPFAPGEMITLSATGGTSGNPVVFSIDTQDSTGTGMINGNILTLTGAGNIVIDANQAGNSNYTAAPQVQQSVVVLTPGATLLNGILYLVGGNTNDTVNINHVGTSNTGTTGIQVQGQLNGVNLNNAYNNIPPNYPIPTSIYIAGFNGNDNITEENSLTIPVVVVEGNGNDNIQLGRGNNNVTVGSGKDQVRVGNGNNTIVANTGAGQVHINLGNGTNMVTVYDTATGQANVQAGDGTNTVTLGNGNDMVAVGNGSNTVTLGNGNDATILGNGNNLFLEGNGNDLVLAGNGDNLIVGGLGKHAILAGNGSNILIDGSVALSTAALDQVLAEWVQNGGSPANVATIRSTLTPALTPNFSNANTLLAGSGSDWFWANSLAQDHLNRTPNLFD
jgi:hypothetical protein